MAMEQTCSEEMESESAVQDIAPSVVFQTPPPGATAYRTASVRGSAASITTRAGAPKGPRKFHEKDCAFSDPRRPMPRHKAINAKDVRLMNCRNRCTIARTRYSSGSDDDRQ